MNRDINRKNDWVGKGVRRSHIGGNYKQDKLSSRSREEKSVMKEENTK